MIVTLCLFAVCFLYAIASYTTYNSSIRDSNAIFPINWAVAFASSTIWILMVRTLNDTNKIVAASLAWDVIVTLIYAVIPAVIQGKNLNWQAYAAMVVVFMALLWFRLATE
jgi:hypothetical protein